MHRAGDIGCASGSIRSGAAFLPINKQGLKTVALGKTGWRLGGLKGECAFM